MTEVNRFRDADSVDALLAQAIGAGSTCWSNPGGAGVFDSLEALYVFYDAKRRLSELMEP